MSVRSKDSRKKRGSLFDIVGNSDSESGGEKHEKEQLEVPTSQGEPPSPSKNIARKGTVRRIMSPFSVSLDSDPSAAIPENTSPDSSFVKEKPKKHKKKEGGSKLVADPTSNQQISFPYENWIHDYYNTEGNDLNDSFLLFPKDDIIMARQPKVHRTNAAKKALESNEYAQYEYHVKDLIKRYCNDFSYLVKNYAEYQKVEDDSIYDLPTFEYDEDSNDSDALLHKMRQYRDYIEKQKTVGLNQLYFEYIQLIQHETDVGNSENRMQYRIPVFHAFASDFQYLSKGIDQLGLCFEKPAPAQAKFLLTENSNGEGKEVVQVHQSIREVRFVNPMKLCIRVKQLNFALGELEPFFGTLALYNIKTKQKLSEDFHFHTNSMAVLDKYFDKEEIAIMKDPILQSVFTVAKPSEDVHLVLKIEKVLQGDVEDAQEPYMNLQQHGNEAAKKKLSDVIESSCHRLVAYRQPFAWSSMQMFTPTGAFNFSLTTSTSGSTNSQIVFKYIYRTSTKEMSDESLLDLIVDSREHTKSLEALRKKSIPGVFVMTISEWKEDDIPAQIQLMDPSLDSVNKQYFASAQNLEIGNQHQDSDEPRDSQATASANAKKTESENNNSEVKDPNVSYSVYGSASLGNFPTGNLPASSVNSHANVVREIQEFADVNYYRTHSNFVNNLYVYCTSIDSNLSSKKGSKNIGVRVEIKEEDSYEGKRLKNIYNKMSQFEEHRFVDSITTQVNCGTRQPEFSDEIKIKLPARLTHRHHVLFTFFNVQVKQKKDKKNEEDLETPIGYAYLPLYAGYKISDEEHHLPVFTQKAEDAKKWKNYLTDKELSYMDGGKPMFSVKFRLVSSVFTQDKHMASFFQFYGCPNHIVKDQSLKAQLMESVRGLKEVSLKTFIEFHPIILNGLFTLMSKFFSDAAVPMECLKTVLALLSKLSLDTPDPQIRQQIVQQYVNVYFDLIKADTTNAEYIFTAITETLLMYFIEKKAMMASVDFEELRNMGILFSIILKSLALKVVTSGELYKDSLNRSHWFSDKFVRSVKKVCSYITSQFTDRCTKAMEGQTLGTHEFKAIIEANRYMALFIRDLCSVLDRGAVLDMILGYTREILPEGLLSDSAMGTRLLFFKYDFQKIICEYEHFVPMNFPVNFVIDSDIMDNLRQNLCLRHPLITMLFEEIRGTLESQTLASLRIKVFQNLHLLLAKHDYDSKYQTVESKNRLATLYFQLIPLLLDDWNTAFLSRWREIADVNEKRNLYISVIYVLKNIPKGFLLQWWQQETKERLLIFLDMLAECVAAFEFQSSDEGKEVNKPSSLEKNKDKSTSNQRRKTLSQETGNSLNSTSSSSDSEKGKTPEHKNNSMKRKLQTPQRKRFMEGAQNYECSVTILDTIEEFMHCFHDELVASSEMPANSSNESEEKRKKKSVASDSSDIESGVVLNRIFALLVLLLRTKQSVKFYQMLFATYRSIFVKFRHIFFMDNRENSYCSDVSFELLRYCNSSNFTLRDEASSLLYLLVKYNQQVGNFRRISIQLTTALAKLVSDGKLEGDPEMFEMSLNKLCSFALYDYSMPDDLIDLRNNVHPSMEQKLQFVRQSEELSGRLTKILKHTITVQQVKQNSDHELICDLYYRIAKAYTNTPELRVTWLEALFRLHDKQGNFAEAAICMVHVACVISEYLVQTNSNLAGAINIDYLKKIVPFMNEVVEEEESGLFNSSELLNAARVAIIYFEKAEMFEFSITLYKFIIPLLERQSESYTLLSKTYDETAKLYDKLLKSGGSRLLGKYYRIGFYGIKFDELNNKEFIYREPKSAHLYELTDKLKSFYGSRFGEDNVVILKDSKEVDKSKLDPYKNYLQITSVEPYFDAEELEERKTFFDRNSLLSRFVFTTPFTLDGRTQGAVDEQYIRKTILQVDTTFPSLLKRTPVAFKSEIVMTPIENAVEAMNKMNTNVSAELNKHPVNAKALQGLLQGSILASVNEGPIEFCQKFLGNKDKYPAEHLDRLSSTLRNFLLVCEDAIVLNKTLIESNQHEFQSALEQGLRKLARRMSEYLGGKTLRGKLPKKPKTDKSKTVGSFPATPSRESSESAKSRQRAPSKVHRNTLRGKQKLEGSDTEKVSAPETPKPIIQVQVTKMAPSPSVANVARNSDSFETPKPLGRAPSTREIPRTSTLTIEEDEEKEKQKVASTTTSSTTTSTPAPTEVHIPEDNLDEEEERLRREEEELLREEKELSTKILIKTSSFLTADDDSILTQESTASSDNE